MNRLEFLMQKLINGETVDGWKSINRLEAFLVGIINKSDITYLGEPLNRYEELLIALHKAVMGTETDTKIISRDGDVILFGEYKGDSVLIDNQGKFNIRELIERAKHIPLELDVNVKPFYVDSYTDGNVILKSTAKTKGVTVDNEGNVKIL